MENFNDVAKFSDFAAKPVRIRVPASVASDLGQMHKVTELVLERLGCPSCHSGFDLRFDIERAFLFNEKLEIVNRF